MIQLNHSRNRGAHSMRNNIPGTTVPIGDETQTGSGLLSGIFTATKGLMLSQVRELTGLEASTLQNWVKRGWISNPVDKRYSKKQVARILIITALRDCMHLESIAYLMEYINGAVDDRSDDIIDESELYDYLCTAISRLKKDGACDPGTLSRYAEEVLQRYAPVRDDAMERLRKALTIMLLAYQSALFKSLADEGIKALREPV